MEYFCLARLPRAPNVKLLLARLRRAVDAFFFASATRNYLVFSFPALGARIQRVFGARLRRATNEQFLLRGCGARLANMFFAPAARTRRVIIYFATAGRD